jgi:hypothetical protein
VTNLAKWLDRGLDSAKHNYLEQVEFSQSSARKNSVMFLVAEVYRHLPADNSSGSLMQFLCNTMSAKLKIGDKARQEAIDVAFGYLNLDINFMKAIREWLHPKRLEIHQLFNQINNEKKRFVNIALRLATQLFCEFRASNASNYDLAINFQFNYINEILSLPTIIKYLLPMLEGPDRLTVDFKLLYQSFYFSKLSSLDEEETKQAAREAQGHLILETQKSERKMFIFANTFELLLSHMVTNMTVFELYPAL